MLLTEVIEQYLIDCENQRRSDGTVELKRRQLGVLVRWLQAQGIVDLEAVTLPLLRQYLHFLLHSDAQQRFPDAVKRGKLAPSTVKTYVAMLKAFFQWCVEEELIDANPSARLQKPKVPQKVKTTFTPAHIEQLLAACDTDTTTGFRDYVILLLLLDTGIRVSELCGLRLSDIYPRYIKVFGKGQKEREIGLHPDVSKLVWRYIHKYRGSFGIHDDHVFLTARGALTVSGVETMFDQLERRSGIRDIQVTPHVFRHTFSKRYLKNGGDLFKLSRELGHSSVQITGNIYLSDFKSTDAREDHERYSPIGEVKLERVKDGKKRKKRK